jgi:hypothetical protein
MTEMFWSPMPQSKFGHHLVVTDVFDHHLSHLLFVVILWPCHLHQRISKGKRRIMEIPIFHHAKV